MKNLILTLTTVMLLNNMVFAQNRTEPTLVEKIQNAIDRYRTTDTQKSGYQATSQDHKSEWARLLDQLSQSKDHANRDYYRQDTGRGYQRGYAGDYRSTEEQPGLWQTIKDLWNKATTADRDTYNRDTYQRGQYARSQVGRDLQSTKETAKNKWEDFKRYLEDAWKSSKEKAREYYEKQQPQDTTYQRSVNK